MIRGIPGTPLCEEEIRQQQAHLCRARIIARVLQMMPGPGKTALHPPGLAGELVDAS